METEARGKPRVYHEMSKSISRLLDSGTFRPCPSCMSGGQMQLDNGPFSFHPCFCKRKFTQELLYTLTMHQHR